MAARTRARARGEGGCRTRRRLDAVSVDIYLLQHEKVARKRRWYAKEKEVTAAKDNRYRRKMMGCQVYPLFEVPGEVSGNRCRLPFAKHGRFAVWCLDIRNFPSLSSSAYVFLPYVKSRIPQHESSIRQRNIVVRTFSDECTTFIGH